MAFTKFESDAPKYYDDLGVGDSVWQAAVAQRKVALRKQWIKDLEGYHGSYAVRYCAGGVELSRIA